MQTEKDAFGSASDFHSVALDSSPGDEDRNGSTSLVRILGMLFTVECF